MADPRVVNPSTGGLFATTGHRASVIGAEFHVGDLRVKMPTELIAQLPL